MSLYDKIIEYTAQLNQKGLLRSRQLSEPANATLLHFDSNDYLSLSCDRRVGEAYQHGYTYYPVGSGASMMLSGYHPNHLAVEQAFADLLDVDECILFSSGYAANLAVIALLGSIKAHCIIDKSIHASIYDGLALAQLDYTRYQHNDLYDLSVKLKAVSAHSAVITEGIFSMSGQISPLASLSALCIRHQLELIVDEAHSFGVMGEQGKGAVDYHGLSQKDVPLRIIPLGKAFAAQGAIVGGQKEWINALLQAGRSVVYSTAISPALCYGLLKTLDIVMAAEDRRHHLRQIIDVFKGHIKYSPLKWVNSDTAIQQLHLGCPHLALHYAQELKKKGISCSAIRIPTVNSKTTGLRVILNYRHNDEQIQQFFSTLHAIYEHSH
jgi:8-amino-7-oxononanoate synthase